MLESPSADHRSNQRPPNLPPAPEPKLRLVPMSLGVVAPFLARVLVDQPVGPCLVELTTPDSGRATSFDPFSAVERLHGYRAADTIDGLAVIDQGVASLVWRQGTSFRVVVGDDDPWRTPVCSLHNNDEPLVDALRRAFGLSTAPAAFGPAWYWLMVWLDDLATLADADAEVIDIIGIIEAARWHPGFEPDEIDDGDDPEEVVRRSIDRLHEHARLTGWAGVRSAAEIGWLDLGHCPPTMAGWFDDASFARALEQQLGPPTTALERLAGHDTLLHDDTIEMFRLMLTAVRSVRAMDCHR